MLKIAITGNIASGKSTVENIIKSKGYCVYDTDKIAHKILEMNSEIERIFNTTDRKKIAESVFTDPEKLRVLESIIHPEVKKELEKIFRSNRELVFVSVPQLFESGMESMFDKRVFITADKDIRLKRLMNRNNLSEAEALIRINAQQELGKAEHCDFTICNNDSTEQLEAQVLEMFILFGIHQR